MIFIGFSLILIILMLYVLKIYFNSVFITPPYDATKFIDELKYHYPSNINATIGVVTTTRITHATPASTYAHICHRDAENDIASQLVPSSQGDIYQRYNVKLKDGVDVILGGGKRQFLPKDQGGERIDQRNLIAEMQQAGYRMVYDQTQLSQMKLGKITLNIKKME